MPLIPNTDVLKRIATLPLATYRAGETVIAAGTKTGRLLILRKGAVTIEKRGTVIAKVTEPGAVFGELSALLDQPHTADVRTLETSEFRVARAELLEEDPVALLYGAAILAQRLNLANQAVVERYGCRSRARPRNMIPSGVGLSRQPSTARVALRSNTGRNPPAPHRGLVSRPIVGFDSCQCSATTVPYCRPCPECFLPGVSKLKGPPKADIS